MRCQKVAASLKPPLRVYKIYDIELLVDVVVASKGDAAICEMFRQMSVIKAPHGISDAACDVHLMCIILRIIADTRYKFRLD